MNFLFFFYFVNDKKEKMEKKKRKLCNMLNKKEAYSGKSRKYFERFAI